MNEINTKAIFIGLAVFAGLYTLHVIILPLLKNSLDFGDGTAMFAVSQMLGISTCFISGYASARVAGERGFFYGFNVGALGTVFSGLAAVVFSLATGAKLPETGLSTLPFWLFVNGSLSGFAGLLVIDMIEEDSEVLSTMIQIQNSVFMSYKGKKNEVIKILRRCSSELQKEIN